MNGRNANIGVLVLFGPAGCEFLAGPATRPFRSSLVYQRVR